MDDEVVVDPDEDFAFILQQRKIVHERTVQALKENAAHLDTLAATDGIVTSAVDRRIDLESLAKGETRNFASILSDDTEIAYNREANAELEENEENFNAEVPLENKVYWWQDKYRPRKPRYFNRVHTGYEWNRYNQSHYDHDNPPPKIVQGYKFNVFYPDLIDPSQPPKYTLQKSDSADTCLIRFHAGPPYEDIAFKIVNREWEFSHKKGFKCVFERGILHLWFNFKRYRYRR